MIFFPPRFRAQSSRYGRRFTRFNILLLLVTALAPLPISAAEDLRIVMLGDSITAGFGLPAADALPVRVQQQLEARGLTATVENAGVSGDTSAGGLSRFDWAIQGTPDLIVIALGANDGLRGIDPADTRRNLTALIARSEAKGGKTLLVGMLAPPNMGPAYGESFNAIYPELAAEHGVALYPFLLEGVAMQAELNQADGMHPNAKGTQIIAESLSAKIAEMLPKE